MKTKNAKQNETVASKVYAACIKSGMSVSEANAYAETAHNMASKQASKRMWNASVVLNHVESSKNNVSKEELAQARSDYKAAVAAMSEFTKPENKNTKTKKVKTMNKNTKNTKSAKSKLSWAGRSAFIQSLVVKKLKPAEIVEKTKVKFPQSSKGRVLAMISHAKKVVAAKA